MSQPNERGAVAIFLVTILSILLVVSTTYAARLTVSELNQSSQVGQSEQAYYAAEAGVEDAFYNQDLGNPIPVGGTCATGTADGDYATLPAATSNGEPTPAVDCGDVTSQAIGNQIAWRNRNVFTTATTTGGIINYGQQHKDETLDIDTTSISKHSPGSSDCQDTGSSSGCGALNHYTGLQYCWGPSPATSTPRIEFTAISWDASNNNSDVNSSIITEKAVVALDANGVPKQGTQTASSYILLSTGIIYDGKTYFPSPPQGTKFCFNFAFKDPTKSLAQNLAKAPDGSANGRRYIFRIKPLFTSTSSNPPSGTQDTNSVNVVAKLLNDYPNTNQWLYVAGNLKLVDVTGQSGSVKRRIIAKRLASGQILDLLDYVIYSGSPAKDLCKAGPDNNYACNNQ